MKIYLYNGAAKILPSINDSGSVGEIVVLDGELFNQEFPEFAYLDIQGELNFYQIINKNEISYTIQNLHENQSYVLDFDSAGRHLYNAKKWIKYINQQLQICKDATQGDIIIFPNHLEFHLHEEQ
jgi:hypothetical protein